MGDNTVGCLERSSAASAKQVTGPTPRCIQRPSATSAQEPQLELKYTSPIFNYAPETPAKQATRTILRAFSFGDYTQYHFNYLDIAEVSRNDNNGIKNADGYEQAGKLSAWDIQRALGAEKINPSALQTSMSIKEFYDAIRGPRIIDQNDKYYTVNPDEILIHLSDPKYAGDLQKIQKLLGQK